MTTYIPQQLVHRQQAESAKGEQVSWLDLFRTPNLRKNTILMVITWYAVNLI